MPIGGLKEKSLAALRAGIKTVMVPKRNEKDLEDIPADAKAKLEFVFLEDVGDAVRMAEEGAIADAKSVCALLRAAAAMR